MSEWLIYWGTWKGDVLKAIIIEGAKYWNEILNITNLDPNSLNKALHELYVEGVVQKNPDESYRVIPEIFRKYKQFFEGTAKTNSKHDEKSKIVFVIHGRNRKACDSTFEFLRSIGLHPLEWSEAIFETGKGTPYIGEILEKAFSLAQAFVVLMTPDDEACLREQYRESSDEPYEKQLTPQARPNVLFEAGMAIGKFPKNTILIELGKLRPFSDIGGRHTVRLDNSIEKRKDLAKRLENAGCPVSLSGNEWKEAGDFSIDPQSFSYEVPNSLELEKISERKLFNVNNYGITNKFLDKVYEKARSEAISIYDDAVLSYLNIQFIPWNKNCQLTVFLTFYSQSANKKRKFMFNTFDNKLRHDPPDEPVKHSYDRKTFDVVPWKKNPRWIDFIKKYYARVGPITPSVNSNIQLSARHSLRKQGFLWHLFVSDGYTGRNESFYWNGKEINDKNVTNLPY